MPNTFASFLISPTLVKDTDQNDVLKTFLTAMLGITGEAVIATDARGMVLFMNSPACAITGWNEGVAKTPAVVEIFRVVDENSGLPLENPVHGVLARKIEIKEQTALLERSGGGQIPIAYSATLAEFSDNEVIGTLLVFRDRSETVAAEHMITQARREMDDRLKQVLEERSVIFENALVSIAFVRDNKVVYVNRKFEEMFGFTQQEAAGLPSEALHPSRHHFEEFINEAGHHLIRKKRSYTERQMKRHDGSLFWCRIVGNVVDSSDLRKGVIWLLEDISQGRAAEEEREQMRLQLLQAQKLEAIGTLAAGVSHDFNNVLTAIQGYIDLAMMSIDRDSSAYRHLTLSHKATIRATNLVRQLLLFSRRQPMQFRRIDLKETIQGLLKMIGRFLGEDIKVETEIAPDLWEMEGDAGNVEQVVMNLAVNSRDAMPIGGTLTIGAKNAVISLDNCRLNPDSRPGKFVCLAIRDTGSGIDPETAQHIFEPFFSTKEPGQGTGLGLAVAYGIIKEHRGWINLESTPGEGTLFEIYFPASLSPVPTILSSQDTPVDQRGNANGKILLVEDEKEVREFVANALKIQGYEITEAVTGLEALGLFQKEGNTFDLVFSDVVLPDILGTELIKRINAQRPEMKTLLTSGYEGQKSRIQEIRDKGIPFLPKPYSLNQLLDTLNKIFG